MLRLIPSMDMGLVLDMLDLDTPDLDTPDLDTPDWDTMASVRLKLSLRLLPRLTLTTDMDLWTWIRQAGIRWSWILQAWILWPGILWPWILPWLEGRHTRFPNLVLIVIEGWILRHRENTVIINM